jgi:hypothetical protein
MDMAEVIYIRSKKKRLIQALTFSEIPAATRRTNPCMKKNKKENISTRQR